MVVFFFHTALLILSIVSGTKIHCYITRKKMSKFKADESCFMLKASGCFGLSDSLFKVHQYQFKLSAVTSFFNLCAYDVIFMTVRRQWSWCFFCYMEILCYIYCCWFVGNVRNTKALEASVQKSYIVSVVAKHCDGLVSKPAVINVQVSEICANGWKGTRLSMSVWIAISLCLCWQPNFINHARQVVVSPWWLPFFSTVGRFYGRGDWV